MCYPNEERLQLALLIDGDNISVHYADEIMEKVALHGDIVIRQVFGDFPFDKPTPWNSLDVQVLDIDKIHVNPCQRGSNATDIALIERAKELANAACVDGICVASSDGDFACLSELLKKADQLFLVAAPMLASRKLTEACDRHIALDGEHQSPHQNELDSQQWMLLNDAIAMHKNKEGWAKLSAVSNYLSCHSASFARHKWGYRSLRRLLDALGCFDIVRYKGAHMRTRRKKVLRELSTNVTAGTDEIRKETFSACSKRGAAAAK